ncbi:MAG: glycosyltransferase, partial [Hyphomicrobiaceae bacterium]|nr:glycosyltransferase [Hyphomicrobiaceae bacterium]
WLYKVNERVVGYGIAGVSGKADSQKQSFYETVPELEGKQFLLFLSRIHPKKGCDLLIEAFAKISAKYPNCHLVMAGPDQVGLRSQLESLCQQAGVSDKIHWTGMISGDVKWGAFRAADAFALPSHQENFGIVVAEALSCGTPVLLTNKVNIWREVADEKAGLVENDDLSGIKLLLDTFLGLPEEEICAMKYKARSCFEKYFKIKHAATTLVETLEELV